LRGWRRWSPLAGKSFCELEGKVALVTGGARGIGASVSRELARGGARVCVNYRAAAETAERLAEEIGGVAVPANVADMDEVAMLVERIESELGPLDILVANAGVTRDTLLVRMSDEEWNDVLDTNLRGVFNCCRAVARGMLKRRGGAIVTMTSVVGLHGNPGQTNYAASKAGIVGFTMALAKEVGSRGVRVNAIAPGYVATELTNVLPDELRAKILENTPLGRLGEPEDVAACVRFLCSDEARFVTGAVLQVDGGLGI
jgi:3-oxoacyl-[acyl-carrier protein] reductase